MLTGATLDRFIGSLSRHQTLSWQRPAAAAGSAASSRPNIQLRRDWSVCSARQE